MGKAEASHTLAREGIALGERLESPFITAIGHMRLGHALQLGVSYGERISAGGPLPPALRKPRHAGYSEAISWYRSAITLGDRISVRRTRTEAMWGLTRAYGYSGDLERAAACSAEGIETTLEAGDVWLMALAHVALGASYVLAGQSETALQTLGQALAAFRDCNDTFGRAATRLWMSLAYLDLANQGGGELSHFLTSAEALLSLCEANGYDFLFTGPSLHGPPDERRLAPLLIQARAHQVHPAYATHLLAAMGMPDIKAHPGYQLSAQALGAFRVWRGTEEITAREWQRDKARQLFQLLLAERDPAGGGRWLQRDQIIDRLWPHLAPDVAVRDFKVALNAVNKALEPASSGSAARTFFFIEHDGAGYRLRPEADLWVDAAEFEALCERGLPRDDGRRRDRLAPVGSGALRRGLPAGGALRGLGRGAAGAAADTLPARGRPSRRRADSARPGGRGSGHLPGSRGARFLLGAHVPADDASVCSAGQPGPCAPGVRPLRGGAPRRVGCAPLPRNRPPLQISPVTLL